MKKLMTMIAAVAMSFGLFAAVPSITDNAVDFSKFTNMNPWDLTDKDGQADALWTWSDTTPATDEAKIASGKLVLKTGAKVLARKFAGSAVTVDDDLGLFANVKLDFQNQGIDVDSIPTATDLANAKLALFLLDTSDVEGSAVAEGGTNLFAIAGCGATRALYQLSATVDDAFLAQEHSFTIKFYNQALSDSNRAGFMIYMDGENAGAGEGVALKALYRYDLDGDVFDLTERTSCMDGNYLGDLTVNPSLTKWYNEQRLLISLVQNDNQTFTGVEFKGNASIASIKLTDDKDEFEFIPGDAKAIGVDDDELETALTASNFSFNPANGASYADGVITVFDDATQITVTPTFTLDYHEITIGSKKGTDSLTFTITDGTALTVREAEAAAFVDGVAYEDIDLAIAAACGKSGAVLKLGQDVESALTINCNGMTLDLAGKTIEGEGEEGHGTIFVEGGVLTITNSVPAEGGVIAPQDGVAVNNEYESGAEIVIVGGSFDGLVQNFTEMGTAYEGIVATAGTFSFDPTDKFLADGYMAVDNEDGTWTVVEAPKTITVTIGAAAQNATIQSVLSNNVAVAYTAGAYVIPAGESLTVTYAPNAGYQFGVDAKTEWVLDTDKAVSTCPTATAITYNITFTSQDGTTAPQAMTYTVETTFPLALPDATTALTGIQFKGWTNETYTTAIKAISERPATLGDIALVAQWDEIIDPVSQDVKDIDPQATSEEIAAAKATIDTAAAAIGGGVSAQDVSGWIKTLSPAPKATDIATAKSLDVSYQLGADKLFTAEPVAKVVTFAQAADATAGKVGYDLTFNVKNGAAGDAVTVAAEAAAYVATLVQANSKVDFGSETELTPTIIAKPNGTTAVQVNVELPANEAAAFMKVATPVAAE